MVERSDTPGCIPRELLPAIPEGWQKQLQGIYNGSLIAGIKHGLQFNSVAVHDLFAWIGSQMNEYAAKEYVGSESQKSSARKWRNYYDLSAAILQRKIALR